MSIAPDPGQMPDASPKDEVPWAERIDARVDHYITVLPVWQQVICLKVRDLALRSNPAARETVKRWIHPHYVLRGTVCSLVADVDHVRVLIHDPTVPDPKRIINYGHDFKASRAIRIFEGDDVDWHGVADILATAFENDRAGGWRQVAAVRKARRRRSHRSEAASPLQPRRA